MLDEYARDDSDSAESSFDDSDSIRSCIMVTNSVCDIKMAKGNH